MRGRHKLAGGLSEPFTIEDAEENDAPEQDDHGATDLDNGELCAASSVCLDYGDDQRQLLNVGGLKNIDDLTTWGA